jgi:hypothetical protein
MTGYVNTSRSLAHHFFQFHALGLVHKPDNRAPGHIEENHIQVRGEVAQAVTDFLNHGQFLAGCSHYVFS